MPLSAGKKEHSYGREKIFPQLIGINEDINKRIRVRITIREVTSTHKSLLLGKRGFPTKLKTIGNMLT